MRPSQPGPVSRHHTTWPQPLPHGRYSRGAAARGDAGCRSENVEESITGRDYHFLIELFDANGDHRCAFGEMLEVRPPSSRPSEGASRAPRPQHALVPHGSCVNGTVNSWHSSPSVGRVLCQVLAHTRRKRGRVDCLACGDSPSVGRRGRIYLFACVSTLREGAVPICRTHPCCRC